MSRTNPCLPCLLMAGNPSKLPNPGDLALLGTTLELEVERDSDGEVEVHRFSGDGPNLYWSPKLKALLIFPGGRKPAKAEEFPPLGSREAAKLFKASGVDPSAKLFRRWAARQPVQRSILKVPKVSLRPHGRVRHVVYRSSKWKSDGRTDDYIHRTGKNVRMAVGGRGNPTAIVINGGRLTVTERGLVY
jgi:hypothetical protein